MKTIQVRRTRHAGHCWRSRDELISDVLLWTPTYGQAKAGQPAQTYIQQLCEDMGCSPEDLPEAMNDREKWRERIRDICASGMTWWWWYEFYFVIIIHFIVLTLSIIKYKSKVSREIQGKEWHPPLHQGVVGRFSCRPRLWLTNLFICNTFYLLHVIHFVIVLLHVIHFLLLYYVVHFIKIILFLFIFKTFSWI